MKLLTKEIEAKLPEMYTTEAVPAQEKIAAVKFFNPVGSWTWYAVEGRRTESGDFIFFGWVDGEFPEWGYFMLSELEAVRGPFDLGIERDLYFDPTPMKEIAAYRDRGLFT
jgi:hypothetical protein